MNHFLTNLKRLNLTHICKHNMNQSGIQEFRNGKYLRCFLYAKGIVNCSVRIENVNN